AGWVTSRTDRLGRRIEYTYDNADALVSQVWKDAGGTAVNTLTWSYDKEGNELTAADKNGTFTTTYDALNRASLIKDEFGQTLTYSYDAVGNRTKLEDSKGGIITYTYDNADRLATVQFGGTSQTPLR